MPSSIISDHDLRQRLEEHSYNVPPITDTTRKILLKKLTQLDDQRKCSQVSRASKKSYAVLDYHSADDEDFPLPVANSTRKLNGGDSRRQGQQGLQHRNNGGEMGAPAARGRSLRNSRVGGQNGASTSNSNGHRNGRPHQQLISNSETEEGSEEEVGEEEEEEEESEEEEEFQGQDRVDLAIQTSLMDSPISAPVSPREVPLPVSSPSSSGLGNHSQHSYSQARFRGQRLPNSSQAQALSFNGNNSGAMTSTQAHTPNQSSGSGGCHSSGHPPTSYPMLTPYLRKNLGKHGSLGEAISTLPSQKSKPPAPSTPSSGSPLTQAKPGHGQSFRLDMSASSCVKSKAVSSCIVILAVFFFLFLGYQYLSLVPSRKNTPKIPICAGLQGEVPQVSCIPHDQLNASVNLYKPLVNLLPPPSSQDCGNGGTSTLSRTQIESKLMEVLDTDLDNVHILLQNLLVLLRQNPDWGITVSDDSETKETSLSIVSRPMSWLCAGLNIIWWIVDILTGIAGLITAVVVIAFVSWLAFLVYTRWHAAQHVEESEVCSLVEQALNLLYQYEQASSANKVDPFIAVDHIRDQLIAPKDRPSKAKIWAKVQEHIRNDSRVRNSTQLVRGEEFRTWQWLPDMPPARGPASPSSPASPTGAGTTTSAQQQQWPHVPVTHSVSGLPGWQGGAFQHSRNVAAPPSPPTSCLKVRHMFEAARMKQIKGWEAGVKSEIVSRCRDAEILHIAIDSKSEEGTVYIKTKSTTDAGLVFRCLHGQWYRGQLVTAKYLKLERYHERFPDSRGCSSPLKR